MEHTLCANTPYDEMALLKRTIAGAGTERNPFFNIIWKQTENHFNSGRLKPRTENFQVIPYIIHSESTAQIYFFGTMASKQAGNNSIYNNNEQTLNARNIRTFIYVITFFFWKMIVNLIRMSQNFLFVYNSDNKKKCYWTVSKIKLIPGGGSQ